MKLALVLSASFLAVMSGTAMAADLPPTPVGIDWSGFYIGANGGYGWINSDNLNVYNFTGDLDAEESGVDFRRSLGDLSNDGFFGGVQAGYNHQIDSLVLGIEGDFQLSGISGSASRTSSVDTAIGEIINKASGQLDWFGTLRARAGVLASDDLLLYVTGGLAVASGELEVSSKWWYMPDASTTNTLKDEGEHWGYTIGGGAEYAFTDNWSLKVEYQYLDFGSVSVNDSQSASIGFPGYEVLVKTNDVDLRMQTVRAGINYHF